jgi:hypothetical protein
VIEQRIREVLKTIIMSYLDLVPPDQRAVLFEEVSATLREKLSKRDTQRVKVPDLLP